MAELRASERLYRGIGESIEYGVWVCDAAGRNLYASESFLRLVGLTQEECSSFGWSEVLHPDDVAETLSAWQDCVRDGTHWDREHRFRGVDGKWHPILARGVPVRNERGEITAWVGINLDISELKQVEDELRVADRRKDEFLATLAHELRNPLAPIRNGLEVLRRAPTRRGRARGARHDGAPVRADGAARRRPARREPHQPRHDRAAPRARRPGRRGARAPSRRAGRSSSWPGTTSP